MKNEKKKKLESRAIEKEMGSGCVEKESRSWRNSLYSASS